MKLETFKSEMQRGLEKMKLELKQEELEKFYYYMENLIEWNKKINLTSIIEPEEIIVKHFVDSLTINQYVDEVDTMIDIGTGAGFPGIPIKIVNKDCKITLLDSLNKRILFLQDTINKLGLAKIEAIHGRAEEMGKNGEYREKYDIATSRAVAPLNILVEYLMPFVKTGGKIICMKGLNIREELEQAEKSINLLGGIVHKIDNFKLPNTDMERNIIVINKIRKTPNKYPRKAGIPSKSPIV